MVTNQAHKVKSQYSKYTCTLYTIHDSLQCQSLCKFLLGLSSDRLKQWEVYLDSSITSECLCECKCMSLLCPLIGSVWHTFLLNSNPPVCWTLWVVFSSVLFILGSCPGLHHHGNICTEGSWVLQIQVWIKVIRSCKALFTNNAVTLIIELLPTWALNYKSSFLLPSSFASIVV